MDSLVKKCSRCKRSLELDRFGVDRGRKSGLHPQCKDCTKEYSLRRKFKKAEYDKIYRAKNRKKITKQIIEWARKNPEKRKKHVEKWLLTKPEGYISDKTKRWAQRNQDKVRLARIKFYRKHADRLREKHRKWMRDNKKQVYAYNATKRKRVKQATPPWARSGTEVFKQMRAFYLKRPNGCHVDHIIPLRGKNVCGLHVPWNLQYLSATENLSKYNKHLTFGTPPFTSTWVGGP